MPRYAALIYEPKENEGAGTEAAWSQLMAEYTDFGDTAGAAGVIGGGEALQPTATADTPPAAQLVRTQCNKFSLADQTSCDACLGTWGSPRRAAPNMNYTRSSDATGIEKGAGYQKGPSRTPTPRSGARSHAGAMRTASSARPVLSARQVARV